MYIEVDIRLLNSNIIQVKVSSFHFIIATLKTFLLETIAKTRPLSIDNLVMKSTLEAVVYISLVLQTFLSKLSNFLFKQNTKTILYIYMVLILYMICIASTYVL